MKRHLTVVRVVVVDKKSGEDIEFKVPEDVIAFAFDTINSISFES